MLPWNQAPLGEKNRKEHTPPQVHMYIDVDIMANDF